MSRGEIPVIAGARCPGVCYYPACRSRPELCLPGPGTLVKWANGVAYTIFDVEEITLPKGQLPPKGSLYWEIKDAAK